MAHARTLRRTLLAVQIAVLFGALGATAVRAQGATIDISPATVAAGGTVTVTGVVPTTGDASCPPEDVATLTSDAALFPPDGFGPELTRDGNGSFQLTYVVDPTTGAGVYDVAVRCGGGNVGISATLDVRAAVAPTTAPNSTTNAVVTTAPPVVIATAVTAPQTTTASGDDGGPFRRWVVGVIAAILIAVMLVVWTRRPSAK